MDIKTLEELMITYGVALRAIPWVITGIYEARHIDEFPDGKNMYLEEYHREMLVVKRAPENAGKFIFEAKQGNSSMDRFFGKKYYDSIEEAMSDLLKQQKEE